MIYSFVYLIEGPQRSWRRITPPYDITPTILPRLYIHITPTYGDILIIRTISIMIIIIILIPVMILIQIMIILIILLIIVLIILHITATGTCGRGAGTTAAPGART